MGVSDVFHWDEAKQGFHTLILLTLLLSSLTALFAQASIPGQDKDSWTPSGTLVKPLSLTILAISGLGNTKAVVVVPPRCGIPVAVSRTQVRRFVVPGTTAQNTVRVVPLP